MSDAGRIAGSGAVDWDGLYRRHAGWLLARLRPRFGDAAEDVVQDACLKLATIEAEIRHPRALLMTIARNLAANQVRARERAERAASETRLVGGGAPEQDEALLLKQIILGLPEPLRDVFVLSRFEGLTSTEIGERLGIAPKTAEWRLTKALAHCAAELRR